MAELAVTDLEMSYTKGKPILKDLNLTVHDGELVSILGPSGCGKTTTLRIIAGLLPQTGGQVAVDDQDVSKTPVHKRGFGMVFQSYALFPHLTVANNVAFGLKRQHVAKAEQTKRVAEILQLTGLAALADRYPAELSGGQQQRVSLARALVVKPRLLLLDEPLSNLDAKLRVTMREEIRRLQQQLHMTAIFVTHDQEECFAISDRVAVMNQGQIEQFDTPEAIYHRPRTAFVARFVGFENIFKVKAATTTGLAVTATTATTAAPLTLTVPATASQPTAETPAFLTIRPNQIVFADAGPNLVGGSLTSRTYLGNAYRYTVATPLGQLRVDEISTTPRQVGAAVSLQLPPAALVSLVA